MKIRLSCPSYKYGNNSLASRAIVALSSWACKRHRRRRRRRRFKELSLRPASNRGRHSLEGSRHTPQTL